MGAMNATDIHQEEIMKAITTLINEAFSKISAEAIGSGRDADGTPDGSDDWDHPSAADAREITRLLGMSWDFSTWSEARALAEKAIPAGAVAYKYADPTEGARWIFSQDEADEIAAEDPSLIVAA